MTKSALAERVTVLEQQLAELKEVLENGVGAKNWRRTVGMFTGDEVMQQILEEGRKIREADREKARRLYAKKRAARS